MNYLVTTQSGQLIRVLDDNKIPLLSNNIQSIYTKDKSFRFIKKYNTNVYILGTSESLHLINIINNYQVGVLGQFSLPGLIDIKDILIIDKYLIILSGLRDSVYILDKINPHNIIKCFNISKEGKLEFFKDRQVQCNEIPSTYFQVFYCPAMNHYHNFNKLYLNTNNTITIQSDVQRKVCSVHLYDFSCKIHEYTIHADFRSQLPEYIKIENEIITDFVEC